MKKQPSLVPGVDYANTTPGYPPPMTPGTAAVYPRFATLEAKVSILLAAYEALEERVKALSGGTCPKCGVAVEAPRD